MATGNDSFMGKAVPILGNTQITSETAGDDLLTLTGATSQTGDLLVLENAAGSEVFYVEEDGVTNWAITTGVDNALAVTVTGSTPAIATGYLQGFYVSMSPSSAASYTTGNTQITGIAVDMFISANTLSCEVQGMYIYMAGSSIVTGTSAQIAGLNIYIDDLKISAPSYKTGIFIHNGDSSTPTDAYLDAFIIMKAEAGSAMQSMFGFQTASNVEPDYFLATHAFGTTGMIQTITVGGTQDKVLVVSVNGATYWIPMYAASA